MPNTVIALKKSGTPSSVPASLANGELAINYADGKLFYKAANGTIAEISGSGGSLNYFGTVNANSSLLVADTPGDILSIAPGNYIEITGNTSTDSLTITANILPAFSQANNANITAQGAFAKANAALANTTGVFAGSLSVTGQLNVASDFNHTGGTFYINNASGAGGSSEGGEIQLANSTSATQSLSGRVAIDIYENKLRFFEVSGSNRGAFIDFTAATAGVGSDLLSGGAGTTDSYARSTAGAAFDKANAANVLAFNAFPNTNGAVFNGSFRATSNVEADRFISNNNGNGENIKIGDDIWIGDTNLANALRIKGQQNASVGYILFGQNDGKLLGRDGAGALTYDSNTIWHAGNDGSGSGLDADLLDGQNGAYYTDIANSYAVVVGASANARANVVGTSSNAYATSVGTSGNAYATAVGTAGNTYAASVGVGANAYATSVGTSANAYATLIGASANGWANTKLSASGGTITGDLSITGNLIITGNTTALNVRNYSVEDSLIYLASNNYISDQLVIGFVANYNNGSCATVHTGLSRDPTTKQYYLFQGYDKEPSNNNIDIAGNNFTLAVLNAGLITSNLNLGGSNAIVWIKASYDQANAAPDIANSYATTVGAASNSYTNSVGTVANTYTLAAFNQANNANITAIGAFNKANAALANTSGTVFNGDLIVGRLYANTNTATTLANPTNDYIVASGGSNPQMRVAAATAVAADSPGFAFTHAAGTYASPTATTGGYILGTIYFQGYDGSTRQPGALIQAQSAGTMSGTSSPGNLMFFTTASGSVTSSERIRILSTGNVGIGIAAPTSLLHVAGAANIATSLIVGVTNVVPTIAASFDKANAANVLAFNSNITAVGAFTKANANNGIGNSTNNQILFNDTGLSNGSSSLLFFKSNNTLATSNLFVQGDMALVNATSITVSNLNVTGTVTYVSANAVVIGTSEINSISLFTSTTSNQTIDSFANTYIRAAEYLISINTSTDFHTTKIAVVHNDATAYMTEYVSIFSANNLATFSANYINGIITLNAIPTFANTTFRLMRNSILR